MEGALRERVLERTVTVMRIEYDAKRDLLYIWFRSSDEKAAQTITVAPGVFADMDSQGRLIGIEVLDASEMLGEPLKVEVALPPVAVKQGKV